MQVLAIIGSPRKGHSYRVVEQIERRLTQNPNLHFEYVFLSQLNLEPCRGCYVCQSRGEQYCPLKDDRAELVARMQQADGVILVSPAYTANVTGLMKNMMDRIAYTAHRPAFLGKPAMLVATASSFTGDTLKALGWFGYTGFEIVARLGVPVWPSPRRDWRGGKAIDRKIEKAVSRFEGALSRRPGSISLSKVLQLYVMKATPATDPKFFRADDEYFQSLNLAVNGWKKVLGRAVYWVAFTWMNRHLADTGKGIDS
jgi:multimeric flavodoxin WrbA